MGLLSIFKRQTDSSRGAPTSVADSSDAVQRARTRARQRLIGAAVLLGIGIIGFPLVFETQPRPIPVNIPIEAPAKDGAPALTMPAPRPSVPAPVVASAPVATPSRPAATAPAEVITESREEAGREVAAPAAAPVAPPAASKPAAPPSKPVVEPKLAEPKPAVAATDGARARALLEGQAEKPEKPGADAGRFVVQVGAFADAAAARETRLKVEKLGLKTYTQVASTSAGNRIRVRVGPFASRGEADKALAKARSAGLTAVVLTL
jgi:DedD protein